MGRRHGSSAAVLIAAAALAAAFAAGGATAAVAADYRPLPIGAQLDYGAWRCVVVAHDGVVTRCRMAAGEELAIHHGLAFLAPMPPPVNDFDQFSCARGMVHVSGSMRDRTLDGALARLWPLAVGKSSDYTLTRAARVFRRPGENQEFAVRDRVTGTDSLSVEIDGQPHTVEAFVVEREASGACPTPEGATQPAPYRQRFWVATEPATFVAKAETTWSIGARTLTRLELRSLRLPPGTPVAAAPAARPAPAPVATAPPPAAPAAPTASAAAPTASPPPATSAPPPAAAARASAPRTPLALGGLDVHFGRYHALVIGNNAYRHIEPLKTAVRDARTVSETLQREYGFSVTLMLDATRSDVLGAMAQMRRDLGPDDNLLIYYAGHGVLDEVTERGYWLPVDADRDNPANWISNSDVTDMLRAIRARHVMVVADSCYSGTLLRDAQVQLPTPEGDAEWLRRVLSKRSRTALASGGLEPVVDSGGSGHSVFAKAFLDALRENEGVIDGHRLFDRIKRPVALNADQTPHYADIRQAGHEGGEFLFVRKQ